MTTASTVDGPLTGIRVVEVGLLVQGPQAAQFLHEMGAEVIKVELPGIGDQARWIPISYEDRRAPFFIACNRGKRSITLDLRVDDGRAAFLDLIATADVVVSNFAAGTLDRWGLGFDALAAHNPRLIYAAGTAYGVVGPDAARKGADLGGQAMAGLVHAHDGEDPTTAVGATIADHIASQNLSNGVLAALFARERTGRGQRVESSLVGGQIYAQAAEYTAAMLSGDDLAAPTHGGHPLIMGLYGIVPTADGAIALVGVTPPERAAFFTRVGAPDMAEEERFATVGLSPETRDELFERLGAVFTAKTTAEWRPALDELGVRWAPVRSRVEAASDEALYDNGYLYREAHPEWGDISMVGTPVQLSDTPARVGGAIPELGQHTEEVLLEIGFTWDRIAELRESGAI